MGERLKADTLGQIDCSITPKYLTRLKRPRLGQTPFVSEKDQSCTIFGGTNTLAYYEHS